LETNRSLWDQQAFPWILIRYIRDSSDQNEAREGAHIDKTVTFSKLK
jgi:hypothetical protein